MQEKVNGSNGHGYILHKELAERFNVTRQTMKKELKRIKELNLQPYQRKYSPAEQEIIFKYLGNPFQ